MSKISAFIVGTIGLSLAMLIPCAVWFNVIVMKLQEIGLIVPPEATTELWHGFAILVLVIIVSAGTVMALIVFGGECRHVVR